MRHKKPIQIALSSIRQAIKTVYLFTENRNSYSVLIQKHYQTATTKSNNKHQYDNKKKRKRIFYLQMSI